MNPTDSSICLREEGKCYEICACKRPDVEGASEGGDSEGVRVIIIGV